MLLKIDKIAVKKLGKMAYLSIELIFISGTGNETTLNMINIFNYI